MKKRFIPYLLILCLVITMIPFATIEVSAASNGTADAMVSAATKVAGKSKSSIGLKGEWCASFVYYCAKKSGNTGKIGSSTYVGTQAKQTVNNKGGTITFVNKAAYNAYRRKGICRFRKARIMVISISHILESFARIPQRVQSRILLKEILVAMMANTRITIMLNTKPETKMDFELRMDSLHSLHQIIRNQVPRKSPGQ